MNEAVALGVNKVGVWLWKSVSKAMATTSKPRAGFRGFFVTLPLDEHVAGRGSKTWCVTDTMPPQRCGAIGPATAWSMSKTVRTAAFGGLRAIIKPLREE